MSISSEAVKKTAKASLKNRWLSSVACCFCLVCTFLLIMCLSSVFDFVMGSIAYYIFSILSLFLIFAPIVLGALKYFWRLLFGVQDKIVSLFYYFSSLKRYIKALKFVFNLSARFLVCGVVFYIPVWLADFFSGDKFYSTFDIAMPMWASNLWLISAVFEFGAVVALVVLVLKYYMAPVLFIADDGIDPSEAIHMSGIISKGSNSDMIYLFFSLIGWILLCFFAVPLPFILPYLICCYLVHSRFSIAKYNKYVSEFSADASAFGGTV